TVIAKISTDLEKTESPTSSEPAPVAQVEPAPPVEDALAVPPAVEVEKQTQKTREGKAFFTPVVKEIAKAEGISEEELLTIEGTGADGRVTKNDLLKYIESKKSAVAQAAKRTEPAPPVSPPVVTETAFAPQVAESKPAPAPAVGVPSIASFGPDVEIIPMDRVRQLIAQHMVYSKQTSAHVTSVHEADVTGIVRFREKHKREFEQREGFKLTFTPFFAKAAIEAIRAYPRVNVSVSENNIIQHKRIHLSFATALEDGNLIVPVIKKADALSLSGLARAIYDLSTRARTKKLNPDDIQGGTFTLTNVGTFGTLFGTPIINQPQTAILGVGLVQKRPVVRTIDGDDVIVVRHMAYVSLTYDH
ncbi:MAG: dihydrolipoamide acetyltransferase family protein, partial [Candidatus Kapaibacteriota bacterium]